MTDAIAEREPVAATKMIPQPHSEPRLTPSQEINARRAQLEDPELLRHVRSL